MTRSAWPAAVGAVVGSGLAAVGVASLVEASRPAVVARWVVGLALAHDLVLAPLVLGVGAAVRRGVPGRARPFVTGGLVASGALVLVAWPAVRGYGRLAGNPSILPRDYGTGLAVAVGATWLLVGVAALAASRRH